MKRLIFLISILIVQVSANSQKRLSQPLTNGELLNKTYCTGLFNTNDAQYFDLVGDYANASAVSYLNVLDWLKGRVAGLQVFIGSDNTRIPFIRNLRAVIFIDEVPVNHEYLDYFPVSDIAMIKIIKSPFAGGWYGSGGAIAIYTKSGEEDTEL